MFDFLPLNIFPLPIFPGGGLASSVVTTVWVGMVVVVFFNLRFGWVLSGLVIPGYLVPLLLSKPAAAGVVLAESILTYWLVWFYSERLSERFGWSNFFGRDRFFALVLCSVLVRIVSDGLLLPILGAWFNDYFQTQLDYSSNLHSFGLVIIALMANNFWKTGLRRGMFPLLVTVGITLLIVRFGLMEFTNFNINSLSYVYEDLSANILASPKAYIILIVTAFMASRMNLVYGWDFAGILVPSLLALQWYQPGKILSSFVEAAAILVIAHFFLKLPIFKGVTIEGGRKLLLFFNISYCYKFILAYVLIIFWPEQKITDLYGFGYLLPTLIAIKMHEKGIYARMTRATLQTSLLAVLCATMIGFFASFLPDPWANRLASAKPIPPIEKIQEETLTEVIRREKLALYGSRLMPMIVQPTSFELALFNQALLQLAQYRQQRQSAQLNLAAQSLNEIGFRIKLVEKRYLLLQETLPRHYWGLFIIDLEAKTDLALEVPTPLEERGVMESAAWLFQKMGGQSLAIAGSLRHANEDGSANVLAVSQTPYQAFHSVFGTREVLQVRGKGNGNVAAKVDGKGSVGLLAPSARTATLWAKRSLPDGLNITRLKDSIGDFDLRWGNSPEKNLQRESTSAGFAELNLRPADVRRVLGLALATEPCLFNACASQNQQEGDDQLQDLLPGQNLIAATGSNLYRNPALEDLLFFDQEVLTPLLQIVANQDGMYGKQGLNSAGQDEVRIIGASAKVIGYELLHYQHRGSGSNYLILREPALPLSNLDGKLDGKPNAKRRYWGSYVFRLGVSAPFVIQAPRPVYEVNSFELALALFESSQGRALLVGGASPDANLDYSADILRIRNNENLFNTVNQVVLREAGDAPLLVVQSRAFGERRDVAMPATDILIANVRGSRHAGQMSVLEQQLLAIFARYDMSVSFANGTETMAGYEAGGIVQARYLNATQNKEMAIFWASPLARAGFLQQSVPTPQQAQADALGLLSVKEELASYLARHENRLAPLPVSVRQALAPYFASQDIVVLHAVLRQHPRLQFERLFDPKSGQGFLAVRNPQGMLLGLANLTARNADQTIIFKPGSAQASLNRFIETRAAWLLAGATP